MSEEIYNACIEAILQHFMKKYSKELISTWHIKQLFSVNISNTIISQYVIEELPQTRCEICFNEETWGFQLNVFDTLYTNSITYF